MTEKDNRPANCRNRTWDETGGGPKSGCPVDGCQGVFGAVCEGYVPDPMEVIEAEKTPMGWRRMSQAPNDLNGAGVTWFLIIRPRNSVADYIVEQVSVYEGRLYRDWEDGNIDYDDAITDALGWLPMSALPGLG